MEHCIVCLQSNEDMFSRITSQSSKWKESNIQRIIEKHLWWWYLKKPSTKDELQWICQKCWLELSSFHNFYLTVQKAHNQFQTVSTIYKLFENTDPAEEREIEVKQEPDPLHNEETSSLETCKDIQIEEHNITDIKKEIYIDEIDNNVTTDSDDNGDKMLIPEISYDPIIKRKRKPKISKSNPNRKKPKKSIVKKAETSAIVRRSVGTNKQELNAEAFEKLLKDTEYNLHCNICQVPLVDFRTLKIHFTKEHNVRPYAMCCNKKFFRRFLLIDHLNVHNNAEFFKCHICNKTYAVRRCLETHLKIHEGRERKFSCEECDKSFFTKKILEEHKLLHIPGIEKNFPCSQCDKKFASEYLCRTHTYTHKKANKKICDICGKSFTQSHSFQRHMNEHAGIDPTPETCSICGVKLTNKYGLKYHMRMRHSEENLEKKCPQCPKIAPNASALRNHIKYAHTLERKHVCPLCDKSFKRPLDLKEHLSTHTGEALYTCAHCPKTFMSNANMHKHRKNAHRLEWEEARLQKFDRTRRKELTTSVMLDSISNSETPVQTNISNLTMVQSSTFVNTN